MHKFRLISKKGEGTFSEVVKAQDVRSNKFYALKCLKKSYTTIEEVERLREIKALKALSDHPNIVKLHEVLYHKQSGRVSLVLELMDMNLYEMFRSRRSRFPEEKVLRWTFQILLALDFMHDHGVFHRDVKPENLLLVGETLKLADLGSCRGIQSKPPFTEYISTRWYRAPECLLTDGFYSLKMDIWATGCVLFEATALAPLFPGDNELDQVDKIHQILGSPTDSECDAAFGSALNLSFPYMMGDGIRPLIPQASLLTVTLIESLLEYNHKHRIDAKTALRLPVFEPVRSNFSSTVYVILPLCVCLCGRLYNRVNSKIESSQ